MQPSSDITSALSGVARDIDSLDASYLQLVVGVVDKTTTHLFSGAPLSLRAIQDMLQSNPHTQ